MASKTTSAKPIVIGESEVKTYKENRQNAMEREAAMGFEYALGKHATELEKKADRILQKIKELDLMQVYDKAPPRLDALGQSHPRFYGDHFLSNVALIEKTRLFRLCQEMPKGAHLHIHFNSNCHPSVLLGIAKNMKRMHIWSSKALINKEAFEQARIQFSILSEENVKIKNPAGRPDIFSKQYDSYPDRNGGSGWMSYADFRAQFPKAAGGIKGVESNVDTWLQKKVVFSEEEAHNSLQTAAGAWEKFNGRTQMMKGLFNYKSAYVKYIQKCLDEFAKDNIQYAEIRPNFMSTNHVWDDEGETKLNNEDIMKLIIEGYKKFQETHKEKVFKGLKVIYCTPRSFKNDDIKKALDECLKFKRDKDLGKYIAGFDLIGEEGNGKPFPLVHFAKEFLQFRATCQAVGEDIPFLFHCGETLENGTDTDRNLFDAVLLGAKRIGHGYALPWHPWVMKQMKEKDICVELCPISHEILGLTPRIGGHSAYTLLANNVACTISTDNGTPFRSTLSHDFYQIMAGKRDMTLFGFRQLIEWSIKHSCMDGKTKKSVHSDWEQMWKAFVNRIVADYPLKMTKTLHRLPLCYSD
ncbi:hypothetical protein P885DRAFT_72682 [Corynascus similis CBS 632.67]